MTNRAELKAEEVLAESNVPRLPVNIREIAKRFAYVLNHPLPDDVAGMVIPAEPSLSKRWIIIVNKNQVEERQRFTMAHELGHVLLHNFTTPHADGMKPIRYRNSISALGTDPDEIEANRFAAEILMPTKFLAPRIEALGLHALDDDLPKSLTTEIADLALEYRVSGQAMLLRIGNLLNHG